MEPPCLSSDVSKTRRVTSIVHSDSRIGLNCAFKTSSTVPASTKLLTLCLLLYLSAKNPKRDIIRIKIFDKKNVNNLLCKSVYIS